MECAAIMPRRWRWRNYESFYKVGASFRFHTAGVMAYRIRMRRSERYSGFSR
jgi:hypothetical protein